MTFASDFTLGVEEELLLVEDRAPWDLAPVASEVLEHIALSDEFAGHEAYAAQVELRSPPVADARAAVNALRRARTAMRAAGATLLGAGLHPATGFGGAQLVAAPRYQRVRRDMRGLIERTPEGALHVHVGMPDPETAIVAYNGLRHWLPLLEAVSANSPWWFGRDSGMASARWAMVRAYPGRGVPPAFAGYAEYEELVSVARHTGGFPDYTHLWWDVRPHPRHGTVELREMDAQSGLDDVEALAGLVHALARREAEAPRKRHLPAEAIGWSMFRAARDGVDAEVLDGAGDVRPARVVASELVAELGRDGGLEALQKLIHEGGGAARQRRAARTGGTPELLELLVGRTAGCTPEA
jgi:carboxylate-amine ligase